jgi:hypothetical protein
VIRSTHGSPEESRWLRVLGTLNEYQARVFVADKAMDQGRGGISRMSEVLKEQMAGLEIPRHKKHPDWNYTLSLRIA